MQRHEYKIFEFDWFLNICLWLIQCGYALIFVCFKDNFTNQKIFSFSHNLKWNVKAFIQLNNIFVEMKIIFLWRKIWKKD